MTWQKSRLLQMNLSLAALVSILAVLEPAGRAEEDSAPLPRGVRAVWDMSKAERETTPTRERVCINGLWQWQPAETTPHKFPPANWGYFKVPGCWPGITDYMQKDCQTVYPHPSWKDGRLGGLSAAWYQREITIPGRLGRPPHCPVCRVPEFLRDGLRGRQSGGRDAVPGRRARSHRCCRPGGTHVLSLLVVAVPLKGVMLSYTRHGLGAAGQGHGPAPRSVRRRLSAWLLPAGARIDDVRVDTSVRQGRITFDAALAGPRRRPSAIRLRARITQDGRDGDRFTSKAFTGVRPRERPLHVPANGSQIGSGTCTRPGNMQSLSLSLLDAKGQVLDTFFDQRFGFREFWIDGRDFFLNGTRIFLSAVPLDNAQVGAAAGHLRGRPREPGAAQELRHQLRLHAQLRLRAGLPPRASPRSSGPRTTWACSSRFSQPHFSHYDWKAPDADRDNGYARHAEFYVRAAAEPPLGRVLLA